MQWVVEDCLALDSNSLAKMGMFAGETVSSGLKWESGANIGLLYRRRALELLYNMDGEQNNQVVAVARVSCHFGGLRYYFHCPGCHKRVYKLRLAHSGFYCRQCYRLPYYSQECGYIDGLIRKIHKLEARLEDMPKHARSKTVDRHVARLEVAEREFNGAMLAKIGAFECLRHGLPGE
jgi:hypothetical protein